MKRVNNKWRDSSCWIGGDQRLELKTESGGLMNENQTCQMGGAHGDRAARIQALKTSVKTSFAHISAP